jgi:hypothetical protein
VSPTIAALVLLTMLVVGGPRTVVGAPLGVLIITVTHENLRYVENSFSVNQMLPCEEDAFRIAHVEIVAWVSELLSIDRMDAYQLVSQVALGPTANVKTAEPQASRFSLFWGW